ncbi:MAG: alpha/beta hydrolase [SAR202 cluster bacterium]|nr:alpha/beta hydrolase [SAR202 cluster bacterium]
MPLDPQQKAILDAMAARRADPNATPQQRRDAMKSMPRPQGPAVYQTADRTIPGPVGGIPIRVYTPVGAGPFPVLVWFHGGGWVVGDIEMSDATARQLCVNAECIVVNVDYRLAPEHKFPIPAEECYAATVWTHKNGAMHNIDTSRIAVGGDSAGGNLAAAVALMAKERGGPKLSHQLLVYPVTNHDYNTRSYQDNTTYGLNKDSMVWFWNHYLAKPEDGMTPLASPLQARDLKGLPPALVITGEFDPLRDEGNEYAKRLQAAGVPTVNKTYEGVAHGFFGQWAMIDKGKQAVMQASEALKAAFARQPAGAR